MNRTPLVGRAQELAVLTGLVERSAQGGAPLAFVHGEAGIGKTALVRELVAEAKDVTVLAAAGEETETALSLGVVGQLLDRARPPASGADPPPTAFAAGAALVAAVSDLEVQRPVLLWVDDLHWVDAASQQAILFALRRLTVDPVCTVLSARSFDDPAVAPGFLRLHRDPRATDLALHGLDAAAVGALAQQHGVDLPVGTARRLAEHTSGNPLWSTALLRELSPEQLSSLPAELPAPGELRAVVVALLDRASTDARRLVEASAVAGADWPLGLLARAGSVTAPATALAEGLGAGLVTEAPGPPPHVRPAHALVRAAVLSSLTTGRRLDLHARLAELAPDARLRHEIAASPGADDALSARAAAAAAEAGTRGDLVGATELLEAAARLGTDPERDGRLLEEAAATGLMSGDVHRARALVGALADLEPTPRRLLLRAWLALNEGQHPEAEARLRVALERAASSDDRTVLPEASRLMAHVLLLGGREAEAVDHARRAVELEPAGTLGASMARAVLLTSLALLGRHEEMEATAGFGDDPRPDQLITAVCRGNARSYVGDWAGATRDLDAVIRASRVIGISDFLSAAWANLAKVQYLTGDWDSARQNAQQAVEVVADTDQFWTLSPVHSTAALVPARRGDWDTARTHVAIALSAARSHREAMSIRYAGTAAATIAHSRGRPDEVLEAVAPVVESYAGAMPGQPGTLEWPALYAEALVRTGRREDARRVLDDLEAKEVRTWLTAPVARVRGLVQAADGALEQALATFDRAAGLATDLGLPFDLALVRLERGSVLFRTGRRADALDAVRAALDGFVALGARPFVDLAAADLAALGAAPAVSTSPRPALTPQELAVSRLVRDGLTNREIATELFLSTKTVEFHLRHVYMKLGIRSRTQLVARSAELLDLRQVKDERDRTL
jgi:DNA-binding CsgD family transcriptional regulator/tetratricopeptide (TPR) repeat protein